MKLARNLRSCCLASLAFAAPAATQTLSADVVRNADDTVTYTFDVAGPARGTAFLYVTTTLSPMPLPTPFGPLYLDPLSMVGLGAMPLDLRGFGHFALTVPVSLTDGLSVFSQAVVLDQNLTPRLTHNWGGACHHGLPRDVPESMVWSTDGGNAARVQFQGQARFHKIIFRDREGRLLGECTLQTGATGMTPKQDVGLPRGLRPDDTYETWESGDGQQWTTNRGPRRVGN
jgi:hypothetical protein